MSNESGNNNLIDLLEDTNMNNWFMAVLFSALTFSAFKFVDQQHLTVLNEATGIATGLLGLNNLILAIRTTWHLRKI